LQRLIEYYAIALLDPRFKQKVFSSSSSAAVAKLMFIAEHEALEETEEDSTPKSPRIDPNTSATNKKSSLLKYDIV